MGTGSLHNGSTPKKVYSVSEVADILEVSKQSVYKLINTGVFHTVRIGASIRISKKSFDNWLEQQTSNL